MKTCGWKSRTRSKKKNRELSTRMSGLTSDFLMPNEKLAMSNDCVCAPVIAHFSLLILRFFTESWGKSSLGARLRTRKVTGRDASLPAPLLAASLELAAHGTVGALPQTPAGTLSLHPARGNCPLTLFGCPAWLRFPTILCRSSYAFTSPNSLSRTASASFRCSSGII